MSTAPKIDMAKITAASKDGQSAQETKAEESISKAPETPQLVPKPVQVNSLRTFVGDFAEYETFLLSDGTPVTFYKCFFQTTDKKVADAVSQLKGVEEVTLPADYVVPQPPARQRSRNWASQSQSNESPTTISVVELLNRAVGNSSNAVPQAAASISTK